MACFRSAFICAIAIFLIFDNFLFIQCRRTSSGGRSGGGSRSWGGGSSSSFGKSYSSGSSSSFGKSYSSGSSSSHSFSRPSGSSSSSGTSLHGVSSGKITKPSSSGHFTSHIVPMSTGARKPQTSSTSSTSHQQPKTPSEYAPSAPPLPHGTNQKPSAPGWNTANNQQGNIQKQNVQGLNSANPHSSIQTGSGIHPSPSAPPLPQGVNQQPPGPGWNIGNNQQGSIQKQNVQGVNSQNPHYPTQPGMHPPPYPGGSNPYPNAPPPYPGGVNTYPNAPPPPYTSGVNNYPGPPHSGVPPPAYPGPPNYHSPNQMGSGYHPSYVGGHSYYPTHSGGSAYSAYQPTPHYYPQPNHLPPPPPGYSPYGLPYYQKPKSGISTNQVMMGLALWQMTRPQHIHHYHSGSPNYNDNYYSSSNNYHEFNRQRYTTTYSSPSRSPNQNTLEMTHYVVPDEKGTYTTAVGNMTCLSVYNAKSVSKWANKTLEDFYKEFPNSTFPLFQTENNATKNESFTMVPGRIIHREKVSVTCCGTDKNPIELSMLTNGKSPDVNCLHFLGEIPFRKYRFFKTTYVQSANVTMGNWTQIQLVDPSLNTSTPTPLAPFPENFNLTMDSTTPSVDLNQTFAPLGATTTDVNYVNVNGTTETFDLSQTFPSKGSNSTLTDAEVTTIPSN